MIGTTLSHFKITAKLGEGGMGEVYRAEDTKLGRDVAIKVLPQAVASDPERLARFEREAKVLAALNHPRIAAIYSLESSVIQLPAASLQPPAGSGQPKADSQEGEAPQPSTVHFLVMELAEGEDLNERLERGPIPVDEALPMALQITEALEAAHEKGIIHRDLKPANIKVDADGNVKVLDFGLAKALDPQDLETSRPQDLSASPTLTAQMTQPGVILGTAAYMSPEQARGLEVDKRTDIWAFGVVLFEMLAGGRPFDGKTVTDILAAIVHKEPEWSAIPKRTPAPIRQLTRRILQKDPRQRLRDVGDARIEIGNLLANPDGAESETLEPTGNRWRLALLVSLPVLVLGILVGMMIGRGREKSPDAAVTQFEIGLLPRQGFSLFDRAVEISPDGGHIVYSTFRGPLFLRSLDQPEALPIPGTELARTPFFSPDSEWIGFWQGGEIKKTRIGGGAPITLGPAQTLFGASWDVDNRIVFGQRRSGIFEVPAAGGPSQPLVQPDYSAGEISSYGPQLIADGKVLLFTLLRQGQNWNEASIVAQRLDTGDRHLLIEGGTDGRYLPTGHLVFGRGTALMAVPFDLNELEVLGHPVPVEDNVHRAYLWDSGAIQASFSNSGILAFVGRPPPIERTLAWVDRNGNEERLSLPPRFYQHPRLSPDGRQIVVDTVDELDLWLYELERGTMSRLTVEQIHMHPVWSPDGDRVVFEEMQGQSLYWQAADGGAPRELLLADESHLLTPVSFSPDGSALAFERSADYVDYDIAILPLDGDRTPRSFEASPEFREMSPMFSPDGNWLAYVSDETGQNEVYVKPYPGPGSRWLVSTSGGTEPVWSPTGEELFYRAGWAMIAVPVRLEPEFAAGKPQRLFTKAYSSEVVSAHPTYDVSADGQRLLMVTPSSDTSFPTKLQVVINWFERLERLAPTQDDGS